MTSRVRSRTPTPPPAPPLEDVQLPHLEPLDSSSETAISSHLQKKRFLHSFSSHNSLKSNSNSSSPSRPSKFKSKSKTSSSPAAVAELSHSDEDVEWENEARTHLPRSSSRHHHSPAGVTFTILHKGKRLVRNPEASQRLAEERQLKRLNERREKGDQRGAAGDVTMGTSEVDTVRRKGSYNSQQGVRGKLNRAGSRIVRTVGGALGGEGGGSESESERGSEDGGSSSLRKTSTRASSINNNNNEINISPQASRSTLRNLSHIVTHPFSSHSHSHSQPPSPSTSQLPSDGLLLSPTNTIHAAGEDPTLPPSSAPLGMITSNPPQLPRLDSGMQLQPSTTRTSLSSSSAATPAEEATPLPSPPRTPTPPVDAPPDPQPSTSDLPSQPSSPSPTPTPTPTPLLEPLTWGRDAPEALASSLSPTSADVEAIPVERWEDRREEIVKEEEEEAGLRSVEGGAKKGGTNKGEVVWERLWENQRGIIWFGTPRYSSSSLLPTDPSAFTRPGRDREQCRTPYDLDSYQLPDGTWSWASSWMINMRNDGQTDEKGWEYNSWFRNKGWHAVLPWHGWKGWVRRREWIRLRIHPPPPTLSSLSPPPSPTAPSPLPLPVTDASSSNGERERTSSGSSSIGGLDDAVRVLASKMLDRERLEVWKGWLGRKRDRVVLKELVEADLPTLLHTFTHPSSRQTLLDLLSSDRPDWVLPLRMETVNLETEEERNEGRRASEGEGLVVRAGSGVGVGIDA